uniref:Uncharacterized protein n=1 Tax=Romanomermis culicivorax TaxID=13658 RepID=A0A915KJH0_ROMCU
MNQWRISFDDYGKYCQQFLALKPTQGFITGDQARVYFMQFGLPSTLLAHIWNLSDLNRDGRLDCKEFSIAMHLIGKAVAGTSLPQILPESMKQEPTASCYAWLYTYGVDIKFINNYDIFRNEKKLAICIRMGLSVLI